MTILTDAELVLGLSRHLAAYTQGPERAALGNLEFAGWVLDVAFRLRGSTTNPAARVSAIGLDVGLSQRSLREVIAALETMGWVSVLRDAERKPVSVTEAVPSPGDLVMAAGPLLATVGTELHEYSALALLRATSIQPLLVEDALEVGALARDDTGQEDAETALRLLTATGLTRRVVAADGRDVVYNPNVWVQGDSVAEAALRAADARATAEITGLMQEVAQQPGLPESHVQSTETKWVHFAISQGLVQRSVIQTSDGHEQGFLFTPHLARDPFGGTAGDASGQVRQLVGSMIYAATFAEYRLHSPEAFLRRLLVNGVAGDVSSIGTDYPMLEKAGIVRVVPGSRSNRFRLELMQAEIAEDALSLIESRGTSSVDSDADAAAFRAQRSYIHVERDRARLAMTADSDEVEQARLIAALRDVSVQRTMGDR
ncbi:hypothetical protein [Modestobacter sp. Leaf380]|uniref:hypothetical protein n=1 Tax=Modestobacter sp. Leaf380 TaxID=1736356 RepID=UPI000A5ECB87|nr:hypothetical protein [Modestobacter sp. Leaf380]